MKIGDRLTKMEVRAAHIKATDEFIRTPQGVLVRVYKDGDGERYYLDDDRVFPVYLEAGDHVYNSNGTVRERIRETTKMEVKHYNGVTGKELTEDGKAVKKKEKTAVKKKAEVQEKTAVKKKAEVQEKTVIPEVVEENRGETELERADLAEARDIAENSDTVLQYEIPFKNRKTGEIETRKFLSVNAWKLGLIEGYIKKGFSCTIEYTDTDEVRYCKVTLKKEHQVIESTGSYTKSRLRAFLHPARDECYDTFAFRNTIKRIVSLTDVVIAVKEAQTEMDQLGLIPTRMLEQGG